MGEKGLDDLTHVSDYFLCSPDFQNYISVQTSPEIVMHISNCIQNIST